MMQQTAYPMSAMRWGVSALRKKQNPPCIPFHDESRVGLRSTLRSSSARNPRRRPMRYPWTPTGPVCDAGAPLLHLGPPRKTVGTEFSSTTALTEIHTSSALSHRIMAAKRQNDAESAAPEAKKPKHGFRVGPENLPDGPWRRKGLFSLYQNFSSHAHTRRLQSPRSRRN